MKFRRVYWDGVSHPNGALCTVEVEYEGAAHLGPHCYTKWVDDDPAYPVYWVSTGGDFIEEWSPCLAVHDSGHACIRREEPPGERHDGDHVYIAYSPDTEFCAGEPIGPVSW